MKKIIVLLSLVMSLNVFAAHKNIVDIAAENGNFKTLLTALEVSGLDKTLRTSKNITVFAPTDDAFAKIPADVLSSILADQELLKEVLLYHVAKPKMSAKKVSRLNGIKTLAGKYITNKSKDGNVILNTSTVTATNIYGSNGVIHVIDTVLVPTKNTSLNEIVTVKKVDLKRYMGTWNELYRIPNRFEKGCYDVTAKYKLRGHKVSVKNTCYKKNGKKRSSKGTAFVTNRKTNASLKVSFVPVLQRWGFKGGDYNILALGEDYEYALVGSKNRSFLWILARDTELPEEAIEMLMNKAESLGYNTDKLIKTPTLK